MELRPRCPYAWWLPCDSRLISTPRKVKGAQQLMAHDLSRPRSDRVFLEARGESTYTPHTATMIVALLSDCTNGAMIMDPAKMQCETVHVVSRDGLYFSTSITIDAMLAGGLGVNPGASSCGLFTNHGRMTDMTNVMMLKAISAMDPMRPTWPVRSPVVLASAGAS